MRTIMAAEAIETEQCQRDGNGTRSPAGSLLLLILKTAALWIAAIAGCVVGGIAVPVDLPPAMADGPLTSGQAMLVVNALVAVSLAAVAATARVRGRRLFVLLFAAYFLISSAMMQLETLWFNDSLKLPLIAVGQITASCAVAAVVTAFAGALMFRPSASAASPVPATLTRRIALMAAIYVVLYYSAGFFIAWQSAAVRAYYSNGVNIPFVPTVLFQVLRGTLWAIIALAVVTRLKGSLMQRALVMGLLFSVMTAAQLLYPTPFFPWAVRSAHLVEVGISEFVYGIAATLVLLAGAAKRPLTSGIWRSLAGQA
jgi:hypothetical protein